MLHPIRLLAIGVSLALSGAGTAIAAATTAVAPSAPVLAAAPESQQRVFAVTINGQVVSQGAVVLLEPGGRVLVAGDDLERWRLLVTGKVPRSTADGRPYFALSDFPGLSYRIDESRQIIEISAPATLFSSSTLDLYDAGGHRIINRSPGAFLNYSLTGSRFSGFTFAQGVVEAGISAVRGGVLTSSFAWAPTSLNSRFTRLATTWERTYVETRRALRLGDIVSSPGRMGGSVSAAGIQYASDFSTDPEFQTSPLLQFRGIAPSASTVDVLVNNTAYITGQRVPAGPFVINAPPIGINGQGQVRLIVRDALGVDHVIVEPFYGARNLLREGVEEFSFEAGVQRQDSTAFNPSYARPIVSGTVRRGITNNFTAEAHVEGTSAVQLGEFTADFAVPRLGTLTAGVATSFSPAGNGVRGLLGYQFQSTSGYSLGATISDTSPSFKTVGLGAASNLTAQLFATAPLRKSLFVSAGLLESHPYGGKTVAYTSLGLSGRAGGGSFSLSTTQGLSAGVPGSYYLAYATHVGHVGMNTSATNTRISTALQTDTPPSGYGSSTAITINKDSGSSPFMGVTYSYDSPLLHFDGSADRDVTFGTVRGGFMYVGGKLSAAQELRGSYGIAVIPGYPNVRVYVNGLEAGRTDRNGVVALPFLVPYNVNTITVEQQDLPIAANFSRWVETTIPYTRSATIVRFTTGPAGGIVVHLRLSDGSIMPPGSEVVGTKAAGNHPVGEDGLAYLPALAPGRTTLSASIAGGSSCDFTVDVPLDTKEIPDVGNVTCAVTKKPAANASPAPATPARAESGTAPLPSPSPASVPVASAAIHSNETERPVVVNPVTP